MPNPHVINRLEAIRSVLMSAHGGGAGLSAPVVGAERESFINLVLRNVVPPPFRIGTGQITDADGRLSPQMDIVVEYANTMSFPLLQGNSARLYLAESVCCAIEVKSNISSQWQDVVGKAQLLSKLKRKVGTTAYVGGRPPDTIPMFAVGFEGWSELATCRQKLAEPGTEALSGVLILDTALYVGARPPYDGFSVEGAACIFSLLLSIEHLTSSLMASKPKLAQYVFD